MHSFLCAATYPKNAEGKSNDRILVALVLLFFMENYAITKSSLLQIKKLKNYVNSRKDGQICFVDIVPAESSINWLIAKLKQIKLHHLITHIFTNFRKLEIRDAINKAGLVEVYVACGHTASNQALSSKQPNPLLSYHAVAE